MAKDEMTPGSGSTRADRASLVPEGVEDASALDPRGEDLASERLVDGEDYVIAPDETEAEELTDTPPVDGDEMVADVEQLEEAEAEAAVATPSTRPRKRNKAVASDVVERVEPVGGDVATLEPGSLRPKRVQPTKGHATPTRKAATSGAIEKPRQRVSLGRFLSECVDELRKVVWPTGDQLVQYFLVVLVFVLFIIAFVSLLDMGFGALLLKLLG